MLVDRRLVENTPPTPLGGFEPHIRTQQYVYFIQIWHLNYVLQREVT